MLEYFPPHGLLFVKSAGKIPEGLYVYSRRNGVCATSPGSYVRLLIISYKHMNPTDSASCSWKWLGFIKAGLMGGPKESFFILHV